MRIAIGDSESDGASREGRGEGAMRIDISGSGSGSGSDARGSASASGSGSGSVSGQLAAEGDEIEYERGSATGAHRRSHSVDLDEPDVNSPGSATL